MKLKQVHIIIVVIISTLSATAQSTYDLSPHNYSQIPPSPEPAMLMKVAETPVSPFTGQPNISIPIYTICDGTLKFPIVLNYLGGGIKVFDDAGIVGLGWSVNAGGCLSLTVNGLPDLIDPTCNNGLRGLAHLQQKDKAFRDSVIQRNENRNYTPSMYNERFLLPYSICSDYDDGKVDMANDIYHFSFLNYSGTLMIDQLSQSKTKYLSTDSPITIHSWLYTIDGGEVVFIDDLHNKYYFNEGERTCFNYSYISAGEAQSDSIYYTSSLYLKRITSLNGDTITFSYEDVGRKRLSIGASETYTEADTHYYSNGIEKQRTSYSPYVDYFCKRLKSINSKTVSVVFNYDNAGDTLIDISVYRYTSPLELIDKYQFTRNNEFLEKITEISHDNNSVDLYTFTYNNVSMPSFLGRDHWGYHNGDNSTTHIAYLGADRDINTGYSLYGILTDVQYATGGITHYNWEQNDYSYRSSQLMSNESNNNITVRNLIINGATTGNHITASTMNFDNLYTREFTINNTPTSQSSIAIFIKDYIRSLLDGPFVNCLLGDYMHNHGAQYGNIDETYPRVELIKPNGVTETFYIDSTTCSLDSIIINDAPSGHYVFKLRNPYNFTDIDPETVNAYFGDYGDDKTYVQYGKAVCKIYTQTQNAEPPKWGGHRIASIESFNNESGVFSPVVSKSYQYCDNLNLGISSGTILSRPEECYKVELYKCAYVALNSAQFDENWTRIDKWGDDGLFKTPTGASHVEYPTVWEIYPDSLKIKYIYDSQRDYFLSDITTSSFYESIIGGSRMNTSFHHRTGNLLSKEFYNGNNLYKKELYNYRILEESGLPWFTGDFHVITDYAAVGRQCTDTNYPNDTWGNGYAACLYKLIPFNKNITSTTTIEYSADNEIPPFSKTIYIDYFNCSYSDAYYSSFPKSETFTNSDSTELKTFYTYQFYDNYITSLPETKVTISNDKIISATRYQYDNLNRLVATFRAPTGLQIAPSFQLNDVNHKYYAPDALLNVINIKEYGYKYDNYGHITEVSYRGVPLVSYLWGYKGSHPIAEIKNISYNNVVAQLPTALNPNSLLNRYDLSETDLSQIRQLFPNNDVTTITYNWLIGIGTLTDSRGITTQFEYDGYNRLSGIRDFNGYIIKKFEYNYKQ